MYQPRAFKEQRLPVLHALMRNEPFATLVINGNGGLSANQQPLLLDAGESPYGTLRGHLAKANPLCGEIADGTEALVIFHGPERYITPSWYPSKAVHGKVVPTWNYVTVHAYGTVHTEHDAGWLRRHLTALVNHQEQNLDKPWALADAPQAFIDRQLSAITGIAIEIERLEGKWKVSQNRAAADRAGVSRGLRESGTPADLALAELVDEYGP
ncbi:MAG: FMN-binding negative transcriptional regulator [Gammaproteobacteria bacterium]|nr:FMN-binding negative transcriptional regulator [Gammaproteobacteria bacterium]